MENVRASFTEYRQVKHYMQPLEIKQLRQKLQLSLNKFARMLGMGPSSLSQIENNLKLQNKEQDVLFKSIRNEYEATGEVQSLAVKKDPISQLFLDGMGRIKGTCTTTDYDSGELFSNRLNQFQLACLEEVSA